MKKLFILLIINSLALSSFSQSTILLPSSVGIPNVSTLPTCDANAKGKQVFNTSDNKMYFCNGTAWTDMTIGGFTLPYSASTSLPNMISLTTTGMGVTFSAQNTSTTESYAHAIFGQSINGVGVFAKSINYIGLWGESNIGHGVFGKSTSGKGVKGESTSDYGVEGLSSTADAIHGVTTSGRGVFGKSTSSVGVRGESSTYMGVQGVSTSGTGVYGESNSSYGVYGYSNINYGVFGSSYFDYGVRGESVMSYGVFGKSTYGNAGYFEGKLRVTDDLFVSTNKGIIQNSNTAQLKYVNNSITVTYTISAFSTVISGDITMDTFSAPPKVYVANVESQSGEYYKIIITPVAVTTNTFRLRFYNASDTSSTFTGTWNIVAIGEK